MDKYTKVNGNYLKIWLTASLINGIVSSFIFMFSWQDLDLVVFFLATGYSLVFSIPILLLSMLITSFILSYKEGIGIFETVLGVIFFVSLTGVFFFIWLFNFFDASTIPLGISIVASAVTAVFISQQKLKAIDTFEE